MTSSSSLPGNITPLFPNSGSEALIKEEGKKVGIKPETTAPFISDSATCNVGYKFYIDDDTLKTEEDKIERKKDQTMGDNYNDKYIEQRFKNIEERLDHKLERVSSKIDFLADKISDNTEWMKQMVDNISDDVKEIKIEGKTTRTAIATTVIGALFALFIGLACILYMINQMQNSWLQKYLDITRTPPSISQSINSQVPTQNKTPAKQTNSQQTQTNKQ